MLITAPAPGRLLYAHDFRLEGEVLLVEGIDTDDVAAGDIATADIFSLQFRDINAVLVSFDALAESIDAAVITVDNDLAHTSAWSPMVHFVPKGKGIDVAHH